MSYADRQYWEGRYRDGKVEGDWLQSWAVLAPILEAEIPHRARLLHLGCGDSPLAEAMWEAGYHEQLASDFATPVLARMARRAAAYPGLRYLAMDARALALGDATCDAVIDKGTLDAILCADDPAAVAAQVVGEAYRVLRPGGCFVSISLRHPGGRQSLLEGPGWRAATQPIPKQRIIPDLPEELRWNWVYVLRK